MNECRYTTDDVIGWHTGELDDAARAAFAAHLEGCASCRARVGAQQRLDQRVGMLQDYRAPRLDQPRQRALPQRLAIAAGIATLLIAGLFAERERRDSEEQRLVRAALAADARLLAFLPGRPAPDVAADALPPWLGFVMCDEWIVRDPDGLYICALAPDGPLGRAGVQAGDVLLAIENRPVRTDTAMHERLVRHAPGDMVEVTVRRQTGDSARPRVRLQERSIGERHPFDMQWSPALIASLDRTAPGAVDINTVFLEDPAAGGLRVLLEPTPEQLQRTVLVALPQLFGPERLRTDDVITALEDEPIAGLWDLLPALMRVQRRTSFVIHVLRDGVPHTITITNPRGTES